MAGDLRGFALEKAELISSRLKELLSSGEGYVRAHFGVDLGLKPELYPTSVVLSSAAVGLVLLLGLSWAAVCSGLFVGKKRGSPVSQGSVEADKAHFTKTVKPEEQKKRNKKKAAEKKNQSNGQPVTVALEEVKEAETVSKQSPKVQTEKVHEVQAPAQVKKNKKKTKTDVKPVQQTTASEGKEPDDGAWETKVSNREKRQQRRKEKGPEDSGGPGFVEVPKTHVEAPVVTAPINTKKNRGNHESQYPRSTGKGDAGSGAVASNWREEPSVNGGGWTDISLKIPGQIGAMEGTKWTTIPTSTHYRTQPEPKSWAQETQAAAWSGINGRMKNNLSPVSFSMLGLNTTDPASNSIDLQWTNRQDVDDEWSGFNGMAAVDPSSDWNAPIEHWGNYEEPPVLATAAPLPKEQPGFNKLSEDEKDGEDPAGGAAKSKKKRRKKKKAEEEPASVSLTVTAASLINTGPKRQELPTTQKQNPSISSSQKKCEQMAEPLKPSQKQKVRRET